MKLTREDQMLCDKYGTPDSNGIVHCRDCPLMLNYRFCVCKANVEVDDLEYWKDVREHPERRWRCAGEKE